MRPGDLLIQSNRIIGFLKSIDLGQNIIIFHRSVSIISTDRDTFDLRSNDDAGTSQSASSSSNRHFSKK